MQKTELVTWGAVTVHALVDDPILALALLVAVLALLIAYVAITK